MVVTPYGEGRRLAYFRVICQQAERFLPCDISFLVDQILKESRNMAGMLEKHKRKTGKMQSRSVCYNYLRFSSWLRFLKIEGALVSKNANTVFFSTLNPGDGFALSDDEKLAYFIHLWARVPTLDQLLHTLSTSHAQPSGKFRSLGITEHSAETYLEWLVDLDLAKPTRREYGAFYLGPIGSLVSDEGTTFKKACSAYASCVLGTKIESGGRVLSNYVWSEIVGLAKELSPHIGSPVDSKLVAALPILLHLQIVLLGKKHKFMTREEVVALAKKATYPGKATFIWDRAKETGFIRFG